MLSVGYPMLSALLGAWWSFTLLPASPKFCPTPPPPSPLQLADRSAGFIWSEVKPVPPNRMGQCHGIQSFSADYKRWQLANPRWWCMQDKTLWAAFYSSCRHKHQISWRSWSSFIMAPRHMTLAETLRSVGHVSTCTVHPSGRPWTRFDHAAQLLLSPMSMSLPVATALPAECAKIGQIASSAAIHSICNTSMAASMPQQASGSHSNGSVRWRAWWAPIALHRRQSLYGLESCTLMLLSLNLL